jgi:hypothetical protein
MEPHIIATKEKMQTDHFNLQDHVQSDLGQKMPFACGIFPSRFNNNAGAYCDTLKKLRRAIQNKRRGMLSRGVVWLHDNARPHTAAATQHLIVTFVWKQFDHPPYSPDLAPSDFRVFPHLKTFLGCWRFHDDNEAASFYDAGIQKLVPR